MTNYYYLDVSVELKNLTTYEITPAYFKKNIVEAVNQLFGEAGASKDIDILRYNQNNLRAIIRVPNSHYVKIRSSLTLRNKFEGELCVFRIHKATSLLLALQGPNNKDLVIFATAEDHKIPSKVTLPEPDVQPGLILPNGDINWNCPCLGGMATGPCGVEFRNAFSCFHYSESEPKGSDCFDLFKNMQTCMQKYPTLYNKDLADDDELSSLSQTDVESATESKSPPESGKMDSK